MPPPALEALFGWLYLLGRTESAQRAFSVIYGGLTDAAGRRGAHRALVKIAEAP
jgi:hypothetical protein